MSTLPLEITHLEKITDSYLISLASSFMCVYNMGIQMEEYWVMWIEPYALIISGGHIEGAIHRNIEEGCWLSRGLQFHFVKNNPMNRKAAAKKREPEE